VLDLSFYLHYRRRRRAQREGEKGRERKGGKRQMVINFLIPSSPSRKGVGEGKKKREREAGRRKI